MTDALAEGLGGLLGMPGEPDSLAMRLVKAGRVGVLRLVAGARHGGTGGLQPRHGGRVVVVPVYGQRPRGACNRGDSARLLRLQKTLEDANVKLDAVLADLLGASGRAMLEALVAGESDPATLAALAHPRLAAAPERLREALRGRVTD